MQPTWTYCRECGYAPEPVAEPDFDEAQDVIAVPPPEAAAPPPEPAPETFPDLTSGSTPAQTGDPAPEPTADLTPDPTADLAPDPALPSEPAPAAPGFGPSPGFGAAAAVPGGAADAAASATDEQGASPPPPPVAEDPVEGWAAPAPATFDAPAPSSFSTGATPSAFVPLAGPDPFESTPPGAGDDEERFDAGAFDPDALAGTPYVEEEDQEPPAVPAPIVFESAPPGPGLVDFQSDPTPPRPPAGPVGGGSGSSPFSVNRVVAVVAVALGALILIGGILVLTGGGSKENVSTSTPGKTTPPPLGALAVSTSTIADPLAPASSTTVPSRDCDTITVMHSVDGAGFTPCNAKFTIDFPGRPDTRLSDADVSMGKITLNVHSSTSPEPPLPIRYLAGWATLPKEPTPEEALEGMGALTAKMGCTLTNPMMFQDQPAYACKGAGDGTPDPENPTTAVGFTFVRGNIVYALVSTSYENTQKQLESFANSFKPV